MIHVSRREASLSDISSRVGQIVDRIDIDELPRILRRRLWLILSIVAASMFAAAVFLYVVPPRYTSEMPILVEGKGGTVLNLQATLADQPWDEASIISQLTVIQSRKLAGRVVDALRLNEDPEFNKALRPENAFYRGVRQVAGFLNVPMSNPEPETLAQQRIVDEFLKRLEALNVPRSRIVVLKFTSTQPETAATVLNALADQYVLFGLEDRFDNARKSTTWLANRAQKLREQVEQAEAAVSSYRRQHGLFETDTQLLIAKQISDVNARLTDATIETGASRRSSRRPSVHCPRATNSRRSGRCCGPDLIAKFREEEMLLERKEAELREQLGPRHPSIDPASCRAGAPARPDPRRDQPDRAGPGIGAARRSQPRGRAAQGSAEPRGAAVDNQPKPRSACARWSAMHRRNGSCLRSCSLALNESKTEETVESQTPTARIVSVAPVPKRPSFPQPIPTMLIALSGRPRSASSSHSLPSSSIRAFAARNSSRRRRVYPCWRWYRGKEPQS